MKPAAPVSSITSLAIFAIDPQRRQSAMAAGQEERSSLIFTSSTSCRIPGGRYFQSIEDRVASRNQPILRVYGTRRKHPPNLVVQKKPAQNCRTTSTCG